MFKEGTVLLASEYTQFHEHRPEISSFSTLGSSPYNYNHTNIVFGGRISINCDFQIFITKTQGRGEILYRGEQVPPPS